jgi:hypothetical protein
MHAEPSKEHEWLKQFVGEWTYESECDMGEGKPRETFTGSEKVSMLGPFWAVLDGEGEMPGGGTAYTRMTLGHDPAKGYLGTWIGSMMPFMWVYAGELSEDGRVLTLVTEGPNFSGEGMTTYHDVITVVSENERVLTSRVKNDDGSWKEFVWVRYRRV